MLDESDIKETRPLGVGARLEMELQAVERGLLGVPWGKLMTDLGPRAGAVGRLFPFCNELAVH